MGGVIARLAFTAMTFALVLSSATVLTTESTSASPGGLDSNGCHTCRTNCSRYGISTGFYHRHDPVRACFAEAPVAVEPPPVAVEPPADSVEPPAEEVAPSEGQAEDTSDDDTSEVAGISASDPQAPAAGFGPGDLERGGMLTGVIAGLVGAGIAWLMVSGIGVGARLRRRHAVAQRGFVPRMRPRR